MRKPSFSFKPAPPDTRPIGSLLFADPSKAAFTSQIHTCTDFEGGNTYGTQNGIRSVTARETTIWDPKRKSEDF